MIHSMTGFARVDGGAEAAPAVDATPIPWTWSWEIRSVNSKGLDLRCRLPGLVGGWESKIRDRAQRRRDPRHRHRELLPLIGATEWDF